MKNKLWWIVIVLLALYALATIYILPNLLMQKAAGVPSAQIGLNIGVLAGLAIFVMGVYQMLRERQ